MTSHTVYIGVGTNVEPRVERIKNALTEIASRWTVLAQSSVYETTPLGYSEQPDFLNSVVAISVLEDEYTLHNRLKDLEKELGRKHRERWHEREIDFDILFFDNRIVNTPQLTIPHPEIHRRSFVLIPLAEIAPELEHPITGLNPQQMLAADNFVDLNIHRVGDE